LRRHSAAEFSFLMAIPVILLSAGWKSLDLFALREFPWDTLVIGVSVSAISAYLCIKYFLKLIERVGFMPFVIYRLLLGALLLVLVV
jgi:undecaprenyl-diphosphatase